MRMGRAVVLAVILLGPGSVPLPAWAARMALTAQEQALLDAYQRMGELRPEHRLLQYFAGRWHESIRVWITPAGPPLRSTGIARLRAALGGRFIEMRHVGSMAGQTHRSIGYLGFDNVAGRYTHVGMDDGWTGTWMAQGHYDDANRTYTFTGAMDDPTRPGMAVAVREVLRITGPLSFVLEWHETRDGKETRTLRIDYTRLQPFTTRPLPEHDRRQAAGPRRGEGG